MTGRAVIVGGGLAGLSAAVALAEAGTQVTLFEAAGQAGGRCRSYFDATLGQVIDNGNHLVLSGNRAVAAYLKTIGAERSLAGPETARFVFMDAKNGTRWTLAPSEGVLPFWLFSERRRVPGTRVVDYLPYARLIWASPGQTIEEVVPCEGALWTRLMEPFLLAALNTDPRKSSARLAGAIVRETLAKGGRAYRPRIAHPTLAAAFVDPALDYLARKGADVHLGRRVRRLVHEGQRAQALEFSERPPLALAENDTLILAVPPWVAREFLPDLTVPDAHGAILNAHFAVEPPAGAEQMVGLIGGTAEWVFAFPGRVSATVSAADGLIDRDRGELAALIWADVAKVHGLADALPRWQIVKERRATFAATPAQNARRPAADLGWPNLFLAGDWIDTGLPATIEGALRSGVRAAELALRR